jgi:hypothetical protein
MKTKLLKLLAVLGLASSAVGAESVLKEGECWSYAARTGEEDSFVVIRKIEMLPRLGEVIHISVFGLKIKSPSAPEGVMDQAGHLPIAGPSLRSSLKEKVQKKVPSIDWEGGYRLWRESYEAGQAGIFTKSVRDCVDIVEEATARSNKS